MCIHTMCVCTCITHNIPLCMYIILCNYKHIKVHIICINLWWCSVAYTYVLFTYILLFRLFVLSLLTRTSMRTRLDWSHWWRETRNTTHNSQEQPQMVCVHLHMYMYVRMLMHLQYTVCCVSSVHSIDVHCMYVYCSRLHTYMCLYSRKLHMHVHVHVYMCMCMMQ